MHHRLSSSLSAATLFFALALLALTNLSTANVVLHSPVASTRARGGEALDVEWVDDGTAPTLRNYGTIKIWLCTGSQTVQYRLQELAPNVRATATRGSYRIDPTVGPNSDKYFLRFEGSNVVGGTPPMGFSARFALSGMTGTFNSTIQATNQGASDAPSSASSSRLNPVVSSTSSNTRPTTTTSATLRSAVTATPTGAATRAFGGSGSSAGVSAIVSAMSASMLLAFLGAGLAL